MNKNIRVMHIIDSLALGGAERMAGNLSNALADAGIETHLCATRDDGLLHQFISDKVNLLMLGKKNTFDFGAYRQMHKYIVGHQINVIHAHSSSVFLSSLVMPRRHCSLIWHDHRGFLLLNNQVPLWLRLAKHKIDYVFSANNELRQWAIDRLGFQESQVEYLRNYPDLNTEEQLHQPLPGTGRMKIAHVAGLRPQKDHFTLFRAAQRLQDCDFYCVGGDFGDDYSRNVRQHIEENGLQNVYLLGARTDVAALLKCCDIGVLSSESEGLPVSLLEYGLMGLPVVCTRVGECSSVLGDGKYGILVDRGDSNALAESLRKLSNDAELRRFFADEFHHHVLENYSKEAIIQHVIEKYQTLIKC